MLFATTGYVFLPTSVVWANPTGEQVVGGSATFDRQGNTLTINQTTHRLAVNWQDFSIAAGETTHFNMPSSSSIALNRVLGGNPSQIYGTLSSNGNIILVNNAGIFVGPGGVVSAASFVGSTLDIDPGQFMNAGQGGYHLHGDSYAPIVNQGNITAEKGDVFLIAQKVENRGSISAPNGRAALVGAGRAADRTEVVLHEVGGAGFAVRVAQLEGEAAQGLNGSLPDGEELLNEGEISAAQAELSASGNIYALAIKNTGTIRAKAVVAQADGTVRLDGGLGDVQNTGTLIAKNAGEEATAAGGQIEVTGQNVTATPESIITAAGGEQGGNGGKVKIDSADTTIVQGKVDVAAPAADAKGGKVELLGERVGLLDGAKVDASGGAGGGTVLAGGDYLGGQTPKAELKDLAKQEVEPVKNAKATVMASTAEIKADATVNGDGGKIILWSDEYTGFYGQLFARGGVEGGDGGFVETSSLRTLTAWGGVRTTSGQGSGGLWLLDPLNVTISSSQTDGGEPDPFPNTGGTWVPDTVGSNVNAGEIIAALNDGNVVIITTDGSQVVSNPGPPPTTEIIDQDGNIFVNAAITANADPPGELRLIANNQVVVNSQIDIAGSVSITANDGEIILNSAVISDTGVNLTANGNIVLNAAVDISGSTLGTVLLSSTSGSIAGGGPITLAVDSGVAFTAALEIRTNISTPAQAIGTAGVVTPGPLVAANSDSSFVSLTNVGADEPLTGEVPIFTVGSVGTIPGITAGGGGVRLDAGSGILVLGNAPVNASNGTFTAISSEPTAGIVFASPTTRLLPAVSSSAGQNYQGTVTLNAGGLTVLDGVGMRFLGTINDGSLNTTVSTLVVNPAVGVEVNKQITPTGLEDLLLISTGQTEFQSFIGTALVAPADPLVSLPYLSLGPLQGFRQEGGSIVFRQNGTAVQPTLATDGQALNGSVTGPSLYVTGSSTFDSANLRLEANTYITSFADIYFGGTVDGDFPDTASTLTVTTIDSTPLAVGGGGQIIFNGAIGGTSPLGALTVTAAGESTIKSSQININAGAVTFAGANPLRVGANGAISLNASGAIVLGGGILTTGNAGTIGGGITLNSGGGINQNIQVAGRIETRGGGLTFSDAAFFSGASTIDTTSGNAAGNLTFGGSVDSSASLTVAASGSVTLNGLVNLGGDFTFNNLLGSFNVNSTASIRSNLDVNGNPFDLEINSVGAPTTSSAGSFVVGRTYLIENLGTTTQDQWNAIAGTVGQTYAFGSTFTAATTGAASGDGAATDTFVRLFNIGVEAAPVGSVQISSAGVQTFLNGNIVTAGGQVELTGPTVLMVDTKINTTALNSGNGANIVFRQSLRGNQEESVPGPTPNLTGRSLTLNAGAAGNIQFGAGTSDTVGQRLGSLIVAGGTPEIVGAGGGFGMLGTVTALDRIAINAPVNPVINGGAILFKSIEGDIELEQGILGQSNSTQGSDVTLTAEAGRVTVSGNITLNGASLVGNSPGFRGGNLTVEAQTIELQDVVSLGGGDSEPLSPGAAEGGEVVLTALGGGISVGSITTQGGEQGVRGPGGRGGDITLDATGEIITGYLNSSGGQTQEGVGGAAGDIKLKSGADLRIPVALLAVGGDGTDGSAAFAGRGGTVAITTTSAGADVAFSSDSLVLQGDMNLKVRSAGNLTFGMVADFAQPRVTQAGTFLTLNTDVDANGQVTPSPLANRGWSVFEFGSIDRDAQFFMPSSSAIVSNGGLVVINRVNVLAPDLATDGLITVSGALTTSAANLAGGQVVINSTQTGLSTVGEIAAVLANSTINTEGGIPTGTATDTQYGRNGGAVTINGTGLTVNQILTRGSASATTATVPAFGGAGGNITLSADDTLTLLRNLDSSGGNGRGVGDAQGGGGGTILLAGDVVLDSGRSDLSAIVLNSQGGALAGAGADGVGGNITFLGKITGTPTTSNTLDLRYGNGTATLGDAAADTITLGTLITAADDARSTGTITVTGALEVDTLTTYGRGYSIEILGNGSSVTGAVTFLNTGYVQIGEVGDIITFAGGFDALTGGGVTPLTAPSQVRLAGTILSGNALTPGSGASMLMGPVELVGNTSLNSNVNEIRMGNVTGDFNLELLAGIGAGAVTFTGDVGTLAADGSRTAEINDLFIRNGVTGNVQFAGVLVANSITAEAGTSVTLRGNTDLNNGGSFGLGSQLGLNNVEFDEFGTNLQLVNRAGTLTYNGEVTFTGGPLEMTGAGNFALGAAGTLDGGFNMILSGNGTKAFTGAVGEATAIGSGTTGTGVAAIAMSGGAVTFGALTTAGGLDSSTADVTFNGTVTLGNGDTDTTLDANVTFNSAMFTSTDAVFFGNDGADVITLLGELGVGGEAAYTFTGAVNGGFGITLGGAGIKTFESEVGTLAPGSEVTGFTQMAASGLVVFEGDVETSAGNTFDGSVTFRGISFQAGGDTNLGDSSADTITLAVGGVTLRGAGNYTVNGTLTGAQALTLDDAGTKTFASTANILGFTQVDGTGLATFQGNVITSGASTFNSLVSLSGMTFSAEGATTLGNAAGDTITLNTGTVTLGGAGAYTLNGAMAGAQALILAGNNTKTFNSTVTVGNGATAMTQANTAGNNVSFAGDLFLNGASSFTRQVTLDGMTVTASGATSLNTVVLSGGAVTLQGAGAYTTSGAVAGAQNFTLSGSGTKTFASTINSASLTQTGGQVRLGGNVTTGVVNLQNAATTASILVNSAGATQTYGALTLGGNLTAQSGAGLATLGVVGGSGNLSLLSDAVDLLGAVQNQGSFSAQTAGLVDLGGAYLSGAEVARIFSSQGANFISTGADATAETVIVNTSLSLNGATGAGVRDTTVNGALQMVTGGVASFDGTLSTARSLGINAASIASGGTAGLLDFVRIPSLGGITLTGAGADFAYEPQGNLNLSGRIILNNGDVVLAPTGNFVNNFSGNPFAGATTRILTRDFFSYPNSAGVPGLTPVFGVTSLSQLGANQIGVAIPLSAGSAGPYISEFTTGTGQPYILATQNAVPVVGTPAAIQVTGAFGTRVTYTPEEVEMMTPAERSAFEADRRKQAARVILQREGGDVQEIGLPSEGEIPQAKAPAAVSPAPTAQVLLDGKPLATKRGSEKKDSTQILRAGGRAVVLRPDSDSVRVIEGERFIAEIGFGSVPIAGAR